MRDRNSRIDVRRYSLDVRGGGFQEVLEELDSLERLEGLERLEALETQEKLEAQQRAMAKHWRKPS